MSKCLRDIADVHYGKSPTDVLTEDSPIPIIGTGGIYGRASSAMYNGPAVIVPRKGSLGNPQYVGEPFWPADTTYAVIPKTGVDAKWLYYSLAAFDLAKLNEATGVPSIGRDWLYKVPVGSEEYGEQRRIAEILSTVDEAIEQTEALIAKYQQIKAGLMHDLFTRGVTADGRLRPTRAQAPHHYKKSAIGWIPKEWECFTIGELFTRRAERGMAGLPVMSITMTGGLVERDSVDRRVESNLLPEDHLLVRRGDIAYNMMRMWQGVLGRAEYDCLVSPAYIVMKPGPYIDSMFAEYLLSTNMSIAWFKRLSYGVVDDRLRLYFRDLVRIRLSIPRYLSE